MSLFDDFMTLTKDLTKQADALFIKFSNETLPNDIKKVLTEEKLIKDGMFSKALKACAEKRPGHKTYLLIVVLYLFWRDENDKQSDDIINIHALTLAQSALANVALKQVAELIAKGKDAEEVCELLNNDVTALTMAAMGVPDVIQKPKKSEGGKKGGGSNKISATGEQIIKAYGQLQCPKHERVSKLAKRFDCSTTTIRNYLKET